MFTGRALPNSGTASKKVENIQQEKSRNLIEQNIFGVHILAMALKKSTF